MHDRLIARIGLCAAAAVFAASFGVLVLQGARSDATPVHSLTPAQVQTTPAAQAQISPARSAAAGI